VTLRLGTKPPLGSGAGRAWIWRVTVQVFDSITRTAHTPAVRSEPLSRFLNRAAGAQWAAVRGLIERWFELVPAPEQADLRGRLRSPMDREFHGAFWELYLFAGLNLAGYEVEFHPVLPHTTRRPDFLVSRDGNSRFYLEARIAAQRARDSADELRINRVYDILDGLRSPNFFIWIEVVAQGPPDPPTQGLRREVTRWLDGLDPDAVERELIESQDSTNVAFTWAHDEWVLKFRPWPKSKRHRVHDPEVRTVGATGPAEASIIDSVTPLRKALDDKGGAYGDLGLPFVVAVWSRNDWIEEWDVTCALYGSDQAV
jgi:hypothetical protein